MATEITPPYGTLCFVSPDFDTTDKRFFPDNASGADIVADASFRDGVCFQFNAPGTTQTISADAKVDSAGAAFYIDLTADQDEVRYFLEFEFLKTLGTANWQRIYGNSD